MHTIGLLVQVKAKTKIYLLASSQKLTAFRSFESSHCKYETIEHDRDVYM